MNYQYPDAVLMVFCKAPVPGQVKTRMLPVLSAAEAADMHIELSLRTLRVATQSRLCPVQLWCSPTIEHPFFAAAEQKYAVSLFQQTGADLGQKMYDAFCSALSEQYRALIIGCDCPSLTEQDLEQALMALSRPESCVLGPAEDGGYVLIGLNQPHFELFDNINWGTKYVFQQTRVQIDKLNLQYFELGMQWDVDTPDDLIRYRSLSELKWK
jgi:rSAM/selenodomain-associated transferase 1